MIIVERPLLCAPSPESPTYSHSPASPSPWSSPSPVDPDDTEERYPLVCEARGTWDPWGTGNPGVPPLATDPDVLGDLESFDAAAASVTPISEVYTNVTIPIVEAGTPRDLVVLLTTGSDGYCLGAVD
ncbi:hypothetical protein ACLBYD_00350 [Rhodococcus sp. C26F]